jgi:hypothetical protein
MNFNRAKEQPSALFKAHVEIIRLVPDEAYKIGPD